MANLLSLDPGVRGAALALVRSFKDRGYTATLTSGYRSIAEQQRLYAIFLAGKASYPVAPPGTSTHNYGYAVDIATNAPDSVKRSLAGQVGLVWFGPGDRVHYDPFGPGQWNAILRAAGILPAQGSRSAKRPTSR